MGRTHVRHQCFNSSADGRQSRQLLACVGCPDETKNARTKCWTPDPDVLGEELCLSSANLNCKEDDESFPKIHTKTTT